MRRFKPGQGIAAAEKKNPVVQKSVPLLSLWRSPLTLSEFKILDAYLAKINSHHPGERRVHFSKGELEALLNVKQIKPEELKKRIEHLGVMITIEDPEDPALFRAISLFEIAECRLDEKGLWQIDLQCTPAAMKYIFNIDNIGYLRYKLHAVVHLTSRYSYLLFLYIERNRFRSQWNVGIEELRAALGCTDDFYKAFKRFNGDILKRCQKELQEKTDCKFSYTPIKQGRSVKEVHFKVSPLPAEISEGTESPIAIDINRPHLRQEELAFLQSACLLPDGQPEFSFSEIQSLYYALELIDAEMLPKLPGSPLRAMHLYLSARYAELNRQAQTHSITNRFLYLLKMITNSGAN